MRQPLFLWQGKRLFVRWKPRSFIVPDGRRRLSSYAARRVPNQKRSESWVLNTRQAWELSREVLIRQGVPASAIVVLTIKAGGTLEELQAVYSAMTSKDAPVILVTSKFHTRRTRLTWQYVTAGKSQPIVRAATGDPFDPNHWWHRRSFVLSVVHEYLGLINYYARFAVAP